MNRTASQRAVFLDRDGTIMEDSSYFGDLERVVLIPGRRGGSQDIAGRWL